MIGVASIQRRLLPPSAQLFPSVFWWRPVNSRAYAVGDDGASGTSASSALFRASPPPSSYSSALAQFGLTLLELHSSLVALVTALAILLYYLSYFILSLLSRCTSRLTSRLIMCLIETYLQMANLEADLKRTSLSNGGSATGSAAPVAPIDGNNNKSPATPAVTPSPPKSAESSATADSSKEATAKTPPNTPAPGTLAENFKSFAKFGDIKSSGEAITLSNSDKWFKQAKIIDGKKLSTVDTGIYWKQVAKTKKSLTLSEYTKFLDTLAKMKKLEIDDLKEKLSSSGPPVTNKTTASGTSGAFSRLTDHTKYTGSHKQRFDESGKGRGKAGREDLVVNTGYVTGFKA